MLSHSSQRSKDDLCGRTIQGLLADGPTSPNVSAKSKCSQRRGLTDSSKSARVVVVGMKDKVPSG